jgi:hypothetical protein
MAELGPAIHDIGKRRTVAFVDARPKAGHDG